MFVPFLIAGMIATGSSNSLWTKWQDMQCVENCSAQDPADRVYYEQPVWQTLQMFLGEMLCFIPVLVGLLRTKRQSQPASGNPLKGASILLLWIPAACDLTGTTLMNVGLLYTPVSIYQMSRGSLVLFVAFLSVTFLRRHLYFYQWFSLLVVILGVGLVGFAGSLIKDAVKELTSPELVDGPQATTVLLGVFFILFAQIFTATQFVVEEKILSHYSVPPLIAVGYEGLFGALTILLAFPILAIPAISQSSTYFDLPRGWRQMIDNPPVLGSGIAIAFSISLFNYFGLSVTRHVSATVRSLADTCRTLSIWIISLGLGWEKLLFPISLFQVLGFSLLVYGTFLFNNLVTIPPCIPKPSLDVRDVTDPGEAEALLASPLDETAILPADLGTSGFDVVPQGEHIQGVQQAVKPRSD